MSSKPFKTILSIAGIHAALLLVMLVLPDQGKAAAAMANMDVSAGAFKSIRLKALPKGTVVEVQIESTGSIFAALVNTQGYVSSSRPLFAGQIDRTISFTVTIPESDDYYLVIDNRKGDVERKVSVSFKAIGPQKKSKQKNNEKLSL